MVSSQNARPVEVGDRTRPRQFVTLSYLLLRWRRNATPIGLGGSAPSAGRLTLSAGIAVAGR